MRQLASFLLLALAANAGAAEIWRWTDANGVVQLSDQPMPGAERIVIGSPGTATSPASRPPNAFGPPLSPPPAPVPYTRCEMTAPVHDTVFNINDPVQPAIAIEPSLQPGHRIQVFLNGQPYTAWPEGATGYTLANIYRGSYSIAARVVDADGKMLCSGPSVTFHVRQPSLLSPLRRPQG